MKISVKLCKILTIILAVCIIFNPLSSMAAERTVSPRKDVTFYTYGDVTKADTRINVSRIADIDTLVLPSTVSDRDVVLFCDSSAEFHVKGALAETDFVSGQSLDLTALCKEGEYLLDFTDGTSVHTLKFLFASNIPSLYLSSEDPENEGREWVDSSEDKSNSAKGSMIMLTDDGEVVHSGKLTQIKGRGNTTWGLIKKPYQIKLEDKADLIRTGDESNKSKTWILLANYLDPVGVRNTLALNMGSALDMPVNIQGESIDLYYDGEYRGMYMLTEKVEVGSGRVEIADLEEENENANPDRDFEEFPIAQGRTENGATYTYCEGMESPADISGGYLLEMDFEVRALEEICYICTSRGNYVVVKSPEYASKEEMDYIATLYQDYEDAVFGGGVNPRTNKKYSDYMDKRSLACYYLINEFSKARDCFSSSAYLTKKPGEDKFVMGPLWDYDMSFGKGNPDDYYADDDPLGLSVLGVEMGKALFSIQDFFDVVKEIYKNELAPMIKNVVLGNEDAVSENGSLHSLEYYKNLLINSAQCNTDLWYDNQVWTEEADKLYYFVSERCNVLNAYFDEMLSNSELPDNTYYDVLPSDWFYDTVTKASEGGIFQGDGSGYFRPNSKVQRSQAAQVIFNMSGIKDIDYKPVYTDVNVNDWYADAVVWTAVNGYLQGYYDGRFRPDNTISREEFIDCLYKFSGSPVVNTNYIYEFKDNNLITKVNAVEWAVSEGILRGADNCINPKDTMTRAEMAAILVRYCEAYKKSN